MGDDLPNSPPTKTGFTPNSKFKGLSSTKKFFQSWGNDAQIVRPFLSIITICGLLAFPGGKIRN